MATINTLNQITILISIPKGNHNGISTYKVSFETILISIPKGNHNGTEVIV